MEDLQIRGRVETIKPTTLLGYTLQTKNEPEARYYN